MRKTVEKYNSDDCKEILAHAMDWFGHYMGSLQYVEKEIQKQTTYASDGLISLKKEFLKNAKMRPGDTQSLCLSLTYLKGSINEWTIRYILSLLAGTADWHNTGKIAHYHIWRHRDTESRINWLNAMIKFHESGEAFTHYKKLKNEFEKTKTKDL